MGERSGLERRGEEDQDACLQCQSSSFLLPFPCFFSAHKISRHQERYRGEDVRSYSEQGGKGGGREEGWGWEGCVNCVCAVCVCREWCGVLPAKACLPACSSSHLPPSQPHAYHAMFEHATQACRHKVFLFFSERQERKRSCLHSPHIQSRTTQTTHHCMAAQYLGVEGESHPERHMFMLQKAG